MQTHIISSKCRTEWSESACTACYSPTTMTEMGGHSFFFDPLILCRYDQSFQRSQEASCDTNEAKLQWQEAVKLSLEPDCCWLSWEPFSHLPDLSRSAPSQTVTWDCRDVVSSSHFPQDVSTSSKRTGRPTADCVHGRIFLSRPAPALDISLLQQFKSKDLL